MAAALDDEPKLSVHERAAIDGDRWFGSLSPSLRHDILRCSTVRRFRDGALITMRGAPPQEWIACAHGAVRVCSTTAAGRQITYAYVEPGVWFGDVAILAGSPRTHDSYAHGETTVICVSVPDFRQLLSQHVELYDALLRMQSRRIVRLYGLVEDLNTLPLRARLAKQLLYLAHAYGAPAGDPHAPDAQRITLQLAQEELAQLLGASRQRVNQELKAMEREGAIGIDTAGLLVLDRDQLARTAAGEAA